MLTRILMLNNKVSMIASLKPNCFGRVLRVLSTNPAPAFSEPEWDTAKPYEQIPTPSTRDFLPGGEFFKVPIENIFQKIYAKYGKIVKFPGSFGRLEMIFSFDHDDFAKIYRTEGLWPHRIGPPTLAYWRTNVRKDLFKNFVGLTDEQGEMWRKYRTIINPVLMQPKTVDSFVPKIDEVARDFVEVTRASRDAEGTTPADYGMYCSRFSIEAVGFVALGRRLEVLAPKESNIGTHLIELNEKKFELVYDLDFKPSIWRYVNTPKYVKLMRTLDEIAGILMPMIEESIKELEQQNIEKSPEEQSVLEKLLKLDRDAAKMMTFDMFTSSLDTNSSLIKSLLYLLAKNPVKQAKLRQELLTVMPSKDTPLTVDSIKNLPYLRACMKEQHRLMPAVSLGGRKAGENLVLQGYRVPKGTYLVFTHGLPSLLSDQFGRSTEFIPERWLKDESHAEVENCPHAKTAHPFAYMPFGFGNRACIGKRFVELEIAVLFARMFRNFDMSWNQPDPKVQMALVNTIVSDLKLTLKDV